MSLKALSHVWAHSPAKGAAFVVHLALADYANEEGKAWPSVETLAAKCRLSTRAVLHAIQKLSGKLNAVSIEKYASPHRTHLYTMNDVHSEPGSQCTTFTSTVNDVPIHSERRSPNPIGTIKNQKSKSSPSLRAELSASHNQVREEPTPGEEKRPIPLPPSRARRPVVQEVADFPPERVVTAWNKISGVVPFNEELPPRLRRLILQRINERPSPEWWRTKFQMLGWNDFVRGKTAHKFNATLGWLVHSKGWSMLIEGRLDAKEPRPAT